MFTRPASWLFLGIPLLAQVPVPEPDISLSTAELRLDVGTPAKRFEVYVKAVNLTPDLMEAALALSESGLGHTTAKVTVGQRDIVKLANKKDSRDWWVPIDVSQPVPNTTETHKLRIQLGTLVRDVPFVITNQPSSDFKWSIRQPPATWVVEHPREALAIPIATTTQPATAVRVSHQLTEERTKRLLPPDALKICATPTGSCGTVQIGANSTVDAYLVAEGISQPGKYSGPVFFSTPERSGSESIAYRVHVSSPWYRRLGVAAILLGLVLSWVIGPLANAQKARLTALEMAATVQVPMFALAQKWVPSFGFGDKIQRALKEKAQKLSEESLDQNRLLPPRIPEFSPRSRTAKFQQHLDAISKHLALATLVFEQGWRIVADDAESDPLKMALDQFQALALSDKDQAAARDEIKRILEEYRAGLAPHLMTAGDPNQVSLISQAAVERSFVALSVLGWTAWTVVTLISGIYLFLLDQTGFGLTWDYIQCFLWGLGVPATAGAMTPGTIMQTFRASTPQS